MPNITLAVPEGAYGQVKAGGNSYPIVDGQVTVDSADAPALIGVGYMPAQRLIPSGGTTGQVLEKASGDDFDVEWATP